MNWLVYKHVSPSHKVYIGITQWKVSVSIKEHRFVKEVRGYLEAKLK